MLNAEKLSPFGVAVAAYELPGNPIDITEYASSEGVNDKRISRLLENGVRYFYDGTDRSDAELIFPAIEKINAERGTAWLEDVDYVIHARTQAFSIPAPPSSISAQVCGEFGIRPKLSFGVEQIACAGVVRAIEWAIRLLKKDPDARYALVLTSDRVFGDAKYRIRQDSGVQCDAGTAMLIAREDLICQFGPISSKTFPGLCEGPSSPLLEAEISRMTALQTRDSLVNHEQACAMPISDFAKILPINADRSYWEKIAEYLEINTDLFFFDNISRCGHACCGDLVLNLIDSGVEEIKNGGDVVYCGQSNLGVYENITLCTPENNRLTQCTHIDTEKEHASV